MFAQIFSASTTVFASSKVLAGPALTYTLQRVPGHAHDGPGPAGVTVRSTRTQMHKGHGPERFQGFNKTKTVQRAGGQTV